MNPASLPTSATQPNASTVLHAGTVAINPAGMARLGSDLNARFKQYETDRRLAELKWERNARQFLGVYDSDVEKNMDKNRSKAYPKLTRVKCVSMLSRLMNLLFQADDKNWTVGPSAVPDLDPDDLQTVLDSVLPPPPAGAGLQPAGMPTPPTAAKPDDDVIEQAIRDFAKKRARRMELEIEDQLQELGGSRKFDYVALCRKVLASGIQYGAGVLKGPFVEEQTQRRWAQDATGRLMAQSYTAYRPRFEFVSLWDYYPDMAAKTLGQMDGQFERMVMSRHQVVMLKQRPDFNAEQIDAALKESPQGNYMRRAYETELRALGVAVNVSQSVRNKYEIVVWEGYVQGAELATCGVNVPGSKLEEDVRANVWLLGNYVIKAELDPWSQLDTDGEMPRYHHFIFEDDESFLLGNGLPAIMRDSQLGLCAATRMALDNGAIQRVFELNQSLLSPNQDIRAIQPDMVIVRDDENPATVQYPALRTIDIPVHLTELQSLGKMFQEFADQETFVNAASGGDMQRGPSEPFRTASGASMLRGDAALPFKDVVRNFDVFTESVINAILVFNSKFNVSNKEIQGDHKAIARGATSLIAKEVLGIQLDNLAQTLTPEEKPYVNMRELVRARVRVRDLDTEDLVYDDAKCDGIEQQMQAQQAQQAQQQSELIAAQIREMLSAALKNISQAGKNSAAAEAATANVILAALEKGINPGVITPNAGANDGTPPDHAGAAPAGAGMDTGSPAGGDAGGAVPGGAQVATGAAPAQTGFPAAAMPAG